MSYKAARNLKNHMEIEFIKTQSPEQINAMLNKLNDENRELQAEVERLKAENERLKAENERLREKAHVHLEVVKILERAEDRLKAEVERLKVSHERYEKLRKLNVQQFQGLYLANIQGAGRFDDLVDALFEVKS